jgi:iduronate 2-sulfatase
VSTLSRRDFIAQAAIGCAAIALPVRGCTPVARVKRPNILVVVCDDLSTRIPPFGYDDIQTPQISALARESMTLTQAFCQFPVCGPSRASFLSGLYPESTQVFTNGDDIRKTRPNTLVMPQYFKSQGYWTASVGKIFHSSHHDYGRKAWSTDSLWFSNDELPVVAEARKAFESDHGSVDLPWNRQKWNQIKAKVAAPLTETPRGHGASGLADAQHKDGKHARQVVTWLQDKPYGNKPFLIALGIQKPHVPFLAPQQYFDLYSKENIVFPSDSPTLWSTLPASAQQPRYKAFGFELGVENPALRRSYKQAYQACVSFIDAQLGLVFDELKAQGLWDNTIIVLTSDHGFHLGEHFMWGKDTLFEIGTRVPFIIRAPKVTQPGSQSDSMVELLDVFPTLTDLAGLETPAHLQGVSLVPVLRVPARKSAKNYAYSLVARGRRFGYAIRDQQWRYSRWPDGEELYDLAIDPEERNNLAGDPAYGTRLQAMRDALSAQQLAARSKKLNV